MSCPYCEDYADFQASQEAEAEAQYYAEYCEYLESLLQDKKYDLWAFEFVGDKIYSKLSKEDKKIFAELQNEIIEKYNKTGE